MKQNKQTACTAAFLLILSVYTYAERITFSADSMTGTAGSKSDETELSGEAYVLTETMEIAADLIKLSGSDFRYIEAEGSITGKNTESEMEFTCGKLKYDRETKIAELSQNVSMTDTKNNVTAKAQLIEYNQNTDIAVMQIDVELKQKDNVCTGAYVIYRKKEQMLELSGNSQIKQGTDTFRAQEITLDLDTQEITLDGHVKGTVIDERKNKNADTETEEENSGGEDKAAESGGTETADKETESGTETPQKTDAETPAEDAVKTEAVK